MIILLKSYKSQIFSYVKVKLYNKIFILKIKILKKILIIIQK